MSTTTPSRTLLRLHIRGLEIDAQSGEGGVVNLVVRAHQQHKGPWGRFRQHLANALFRAGDACHPGNNHRALRVVLRDVVGTSLNDGLPDAADQHVRQVWPLHSPNGDAHYMALLVHEGVKRHHDGQPAFDQAGVRGRQKCADDAHGGSLEVVKPAMTQILHVIGQQGVGKSTLARGIKTAHAAQGISCENLTEEGLHEPGMNTDIQHIREHGYRKPFAATFTKPDVLIVEHLDDPRRKDVMPGDLLIRLELAT